VKHWEKTMGIEREATPILHEMTLNNERAKRVAAAVLTPPWRTRIITISNQKGGVGKTTTAVNLAAALASKGMRVLVIDLDPQGNASTALGTPHQSGTLSSYEVMMGEASIAEAASASTEHPNLMCLPATIDLAGAEIDLVSTPNRERILADALSKYLLTHPQDYVFIDSPPSLGLLTVNALVAATEVMVPIQCEYYALEGVTQLISNIERIKQALNPSLVISSILLTMYDSRTKLSSDVAAEVKNYFPNQTLQAVIPRSVRISEAPSFGQTAIKYDPKNAGSLAYQEAAIELAQRGAN
jgi:chromosome partitioning protein